MQKDFVFRRIRRFESNRASAVVSLQKGDATPYIVAAVKTPYRFLSAARGEQEKTKVVSNWIGTLDRS